MPPSAHYARVLVHAPFADLYRGFARRHGNCFRRCLRLEDGRLLGIILGEKFFFRTSSTASIMVILEERDRARTVAEIISHAGGKGIFDISYAAHTDYVHEVLSDIREMGFRYELLEEIDYFEPGKAPYDPDEPLKRA